MIFTFLRLLLFSAFSDSVIWFIHWFASEVADNFIRWTKANMEAQIVLNRPDSPVIIITTTSYNPSQSLSSAIHSAALSSCNGQFIGNKIVNMHEQQQQQQNNSKHRICRDFVRGSCRRLYCKYPHVQSSDLVVFCHDFQNNKCPRVNCKWVKLDKANKDENFILKLSRFLHYSIEDEDHYRKFGEFPIGQDNFNGNQSSNNANANIQQQHNDHSRVNGFFNESSSTCSNRSLPSLLDGDLFHSCQQRVEPCGAHCHSDRGFSTSGSVFRNSLKRIGSQDRDCMQQSFKRCREDDIMAVLRRFDEDHQSLKRRVEANELKIAELRASNEYLMNQNAQLRLSTVQVSRVVNPVTVTHTQSQHHMSQGPQVINATMAPIQVSTPIVSMAASQTQIIATPQNMNGQPISITNSSQPTQILGTSQITLAPALAPSISTPSIGLSINTSQALQAAISNASQPIISYPIMTHSILPHWLCLGGELKVERY